MNEECGSMNHLGGYRPHAGSLLPVIIPLAIGFMLGMRKGMMQGVHQKMGHGKSWDNGVPPFFAELHRRAHAAEQQPLEKEA